MIADPTKLILNVLISGRSLSNILISLLYMCVCVCGTGSSPGWRDLQDYLSLQLYNTTSMTADLSAVLRHGDTAYSTLVCVNKGGLSSSLTSNGVTVLLEAPSSDHAHIFISSPQYSAYAPRQGFVMSPYLTVGWDGFVDPASTPLLYEGRVLENRVSDSSNWTLLSSTKFMIVSDLSLTEYPARHTIQVRAVNMAGDYSAVVQTDFSILSSSPISTGES